MKIAIISDLHTISPNERWAEVRDRRKYYAEGYPYFLQINELLKQEAPDLAICLGDMVDFYSQENRDFALSLLDQLPCPWVSVPGNHDYETYEDGPEGLKPVSAAEGRESALKGWAERGVELSNRYLEAGDTGLILLDSAVSGVPEGTREWLDGIRGRHKRQLLFTHVPLDVPGMREYILSISPKRNLAKYTQSKSPWVCHEGLQGAVSHVFSGHLHFPGYTQVDGTHMHMLSMSVKDMRFDDHTASAMIVELNEDVKVRTITLPLA
jgi:hypothetical protein